MSKYSRNEKGLQPIQRPSRSSSERDSSEYDGIDYTADMDQGSKFRCETYMRGLKCHKGDWCKMTHRLPREDFVVCKDFIENGCSRPDCWYFHPGNRVKKFVPDPNAPLLVQSVAEAMRYFRASKEPEIAPGSDKDPLNTERVNQ